MTLKSIFVIAHALLVVFHDAAFGAGPATRFSTSYSRSTAVSATAAKKLDSGLVIVPFAVPVAVPVATVQQPSVLYSFRQYVDDVAPRRATATSASALEPAPVSATQILQRRCASCHQGVAAQGSLTLFDSGGSLVSKLPRQAILESVEQGRMPLPVTAERLTPAELDQLRQWARPPRDLVY